MMKTVILIGTLFLINMPLIRMFLAFIKDTPVNISFTQRQLILLSKSFALSFSVAISSAIIGFLFVLFIHQKSFKRLLIVLGVIITLYLISPYIHALSWMKIIGVGSLPFIKSWFVLSLYYIPLNVLFLLLAFHSIDAKYIQMAQMYRKNHVIVLKILLKMMSPFILTGVSLVFISVLSDFSVSSLFQLKTYSLEIYTAYSYGTTIKGVLILALPLIMLMLLDFSLLINQIKKMKFKSFGHSIFNHVKFYFNKYEYVLIYTSVIIVLISTVYITVSLLPNKAFINHLMQDLDTLLFSMLISSITVIINLCILVFFKDYFDHKSVQLFLLLPLIVPSGLLGIAIIHMFNHFSMYGQLINSSVLLVYSGVIKTMPFMFLVFKGSLMTQNNDLIDCGRIYQKTNINRIIHIDLPYFMMPLLVAGFVGFASMFSDISTAILLLPPGKQTIALKVYSYLHYGSGDKIASLGSIVVLLISALTLILLRLLNRRRRYFR